jgi:hypothetical protein
VPHNFSPSQIHVWDLCKRKWAWHHIAKLPKPPQAASAALGTRVDALMRAYYANPDHVMPPPTLEGQILIAALQYLPKHGPYAHPGRKRTAHTRHVWRCETDLETTGMTYDLKTTSDFRYALTSAQLARDPQAAVYARATGSLGVTWIYTLTRGPTRKAISVSHSFSHDELLNRVNDIDSRADEMQKLLDGSNKDVLAIEPNYEACSAYGGCPYQENCKRVPNMNNIMDMFKVPESAPVVAPIVPVQDAGNFLVGPNGVPGGPVIVAPNGLPLPPMMVQSQQVPNVDRSAMVPIRPVTPEQAENLNVISQQFKAMQPASAPVTASINPPEQLLPPGHPVGMPADIAALVQAPATQAPVQAPEAPAQAPAPAEAPRTRTRKPKEGAEVVTANGVVMIVLQDATLAKALVDAITLASQQ